jgi:hypothetical protein
MTNIVKIGGLVLSIIADATGTPFSDKLSMIVEEMTKSSAEIKNGLKRIEQIVTGQTIGLADQAGIALLNASSDFLSTEDKLAEVKRAKILFEQCYSELMNIQVLNKYRGDVAFAIATCNAILGIQDRRDDWLQKSANDFSAFANDDSKVATDMQVKALKASTLFGVGLGGASVVLLPLTGIGMIPAFVIFVGSVASGLGTSISADQALQKIGEAEKQLLLDKTEAKTNLVDVENVIAELKSTQA